MDYYEKDGATKPLHRITIDTEDGMTVYSPTHDMAVAAGWKPRELSEEEELERAKARKVAEIRLYDASAAVNSFTLNGKEAWLDRETRMSLRNSTTIEQAAGKAESTLWLDGAAYTIPCATVLELLSALELYALECYNVTERHKAEACARTSAGAVEAYDVTEGYPERLAFTL